MSLSSIAEPISENTDPLDNLIAGEQIQKVLGVIGQLNGLARQAFVMRYIEEDSYEMIAEHLGRTPHQLRAICSKAMKYLRVQLGPNIPSPNRKGAEYV
ncbi:MAG: sigma-70 family RNA polymerase sigma factor [Planctomycetales bacterium]|nr:sigma-70 family RNA polymerase sigma factor [Planctomycetales bacterium]